jgi:uncharacterized zinc-type alcohol dehydrogenase-like protein
VLGRVKEVGNAVTKYKVGDIVGVGCMIDSCGTCEPCTHGEENYCEGPVSWTATYNGYMKPQNKDFNTFGGYSTDIVVKESFVLRIPDKLDMKAAAPILCAGITTYSPLKHWGVGPGSSVAVVGIGGLGHMAVQLARAMGATVTAVTRDKNKQKDAEQLGAHEVLVSTDSKAMEAHARRLRYQRLRAAGQARRLADHGGPAGAIQGTAQQHEPGHAPHLGGRLGNWGYRRNPGSTGFLRRAQHLARNAAH